MSPLIDDQIDDQILEEVYELVKNVSLLPYQVVNKLGLKISPKSLGRAFIQKYGVSCSEVCGHEKMGRSKKRRMK